MEKPLIVAGRLALHAAIVLGIAFLLQAIQLQRHNTLAGNGRWVSTKETIALGVPGATSAMRTRTALHRNRLNVGAWHAYHEFLYAEPIELAALDADFTLHNEDHFTFILNKSASGFDGVRLSRHARFPSACLSAGPDGAFVRKTELPVGALSEGWHHLRLRSAEGPMEVSLDGDPVAVCRFAERPTGTTGRFGFRGSRGKRAYVDDVSVRDASGRVIEERFANPRGADAALLRSLGLLLAIVGIVVLVRRWRGGRNAPPLAFYLFTAYLVLGFLAGAAWAVDTFHLWKRHSYDVDFGAQRTTIESRTDVLARLNEQHPKQKPPGTVRILFVGSSQTWGSGAFVREDSFVERFADMLNQTAPPGRRYEVIGLAVPAYTAPMLYDLYVAEGIDWQPDTVVINLANNDRDVAAFSASLEQFVELDRSRGIRTVFIPEPNTIEGERSFRKLAERHNAMRRVAAEHGVAVLEVHDHLAEHADDGFLWWDRVHLSSFGQKLFAERLFEERTLLLSDAVD